MKFLSLALTFSFLNFSCPMVFAQEHPYRISDELDQAIKEGLRELYNLNFEKSIAIFDSIKYQEKEHPMVAFGVAAAHWWRISCYVLDSDPEESKIFLEAVNHCIDIAEDKIKAGDPTGEAHHVLGGTYGLLGRWQATNHQWLSAYWTGKRAYRYLTKALEINPNLIDAYMGLGIFDYFVATLPAFVRSLAFVGMGNDPKVGLAELKRAAEEGTYARTSAQLFLGQIYSEQMDEYDKAIEIVAQLRSDYPRSPFMHIMSVIVYYNAGQPGDLFEQAVDFEKKVETKYYPQDFYPQAYFSMGLTHFKVQRWEEAAEYFMKGLNSGDKQNPWKTWSGLYLGYCYDCLGKRNEAKTQYRWVLKQTRRWGSFDNAKDHLNRPFKPTDKALVKLEL